MRSYFAILLCVSLGVLTLLPLQLPAQTSQKIGYQAVVRDKNNVVVVNKVVGLRISILIGSVNGSSIYTEIQTPVTNENGLISIEIGANEGFNNINWATDTYFIKTEIDTEGGVNYNKTETNQLLSVPYALHSKKIERMLTLNQVQIDALKPISGLLVFNTTTQQPCFYNGTEWRALAVGTATGLNKSYPTAVGLLKNNYLIEGNLDRLFTVFDKARKGGNVVIGALGGSITEGASATSADKRYINLVYAWWKTTFPKANITLVNAGIGATASDYGAMRTKRDLLSKNPDFVVVDYAVNDSYTNFEYKLTFEGVVRQILKAPQKPAVLLLFMSKDDGTNSQDFKIPVGVNYELPMVSYRDGIWPEIQAGRLLWTQISPDNVHPNDIGHALTADMICLALDKAYQKFNPTNIPDITSSIPAPVYSDMYEFTSLYDGVDLVPVTNTGWVYDGSVPLKAGWKSSTPGSVITFSISGTAIYFANWKINGGMGKAKVTIDGGIPVIIDAWFNLTWGGYRDMVLLAKNLSTGSHTVRVELLQDKNPLSTGNEFRVLCLGSAGNK